MQEPPPEPAHGLHLEVLDDYEHLSRRAAALVTEELEASPPLLLCAATGASPTRTYGLLVEAHRRDPRPFARLRVLKLDEWSGLPMDDPGTCEAYLRRHLLDPLGLPPGRYLGFRSDARDPEVECRRVQDELARHGPIDLCVLGLGLNGHLGLNEPADVLRPYPHVVRLREETLAHPMIRHARDRLRYGLTLGMADLLQSKRILLLVSGAHKREVLHRLLAGGLSTALPASFLWLHRDVTVLCDREALNG